VYRAPGHCTSGARFAALGIKLLLCGIVACSSESTSPPDTSSDARPADDVSGSADSSHDRSDAASTGGLDGCGMSACSGCASDRFWDRGFCASLLDPNYLCGGCEMPSSSGYLSRLACKAPHQCTYICNPGAVQCPDYCEKPSHDACPCGTTCATDQLCM